MIPAKKSISRPVTTCNEEIFEGNEDNYFDKSEIHFISYKRLKTIILQDQMDINWVEGDQIG